MRRLLTALVLFAALPVVVLSASAPTAAASGYSVRAIFDNVASAVPGEDVKVAGAKVGVIESMDVTDDKKAAVVLRIEDDRFAPFRKDAKCTVRPQSLIGEKFVECEPGTSGQPELDEIARRRRRGPAPAAARAHQLAGGPRPGQQHPAPPVLPSASRSCCRSSAPGSRAAARS